MSKKKHKKSCKDPSLFFIDPLDFEKTLYLYKKDKNNKEIAEKLYNYFRAIVLGVINGTSIKHSWKNLTDIEFEDMIQEGCTYCFEHLRYYKKSKNKIRSSPFTFFSVIVKRHLVNYINNERLFWHENDDLNFNKVKEYTENSIYEANKSQVLEDRVRNVFAKILRDTETQLQNPELTYYTYTRYKIMNNIAKNVLELHNLMHIINYLKSLNRREKHVIKLFISKDDLDLGGEFA